MRHRRGRVKRSDESLNAVKKAGRNNYRFHAPDEA
jgi:hypothetical protein